MLKVNLNDPIPRFTLTRLKQDDGARYFGPFPNSSALRNTLALVRRQYHLRGWLHIFNEELLRALTRAARPPASLLKRRPVLDLAIKNDSRLRSALHVEGQLWHELDRVRLGV
jgi:hypothetical protein